ncbi:MAG: DUF131 domain-containing protein [Candidatus Altiarchaeota archaeon]
MDSLVSLGIMLVLIGFIVIVVGVFSSKGSEVKGSAVVFLGPIPIVFGSDRQSAVTVGVIGLLLMGAYYLVFRR